MSRCEGAIGRSTDRPSGATAACSWSGGKDSALSLARSLAAGSDVRLLITILDESGRRSRSHGLPVEVLEAQARAMGIPLIMRAASWDDYTAAFVDALVEARERGCRECIFGDIDVEQHRQWCRDVAVSAGMVARHPLWQAMRGRLTEEVVRLGYRGLITVVRLSVLDRRFLGRELNRRLFAELEAAGVDACGENGEFHTVITDGPGFSAPVRLTITGEFLTGGCAALQLAVEGGTGPMSRAPLSP